MVKMLRVQDRRCFSPDQVHRLIEAAGQRGRHRYRDKILVALIYRHGMRSSEAVNLLWSETDLDVGLLHISGVKSGDIDRTHRLAGDELRDLRNLRDQSTGSYVFETTRGIPLTVEALQSIVRRAGKLANLDVVRSFPNMLRRSAASALVNEGIDKRLVQAFLGQKDLQRTAPDSAMPLEQIATVRLRLP
jgi:site-specific recombinase XerD